MSKSIITRAAAILLSFCLVIGGTDITVFAEGGNGGLTDGNTATATDAGGIQANDAADEAKEKESVYEGDGFRVTCQLQDSWDGGYTAGVRIENTGTDVIESWALGFDCPGGISDVWNAELETSDPENPGKYVVRNAGWNQDIAAGQSVEFGINGEGDFAGFPSEYHLLGKISSVTTEDYRVEYECKTDWETGFSAEITVTNLTDEELSDWVLEFDYESSLYDIWDAVVESHENNHYVIRNHDYNSGIPANGSVSFGFNAEAGKGEDAPENYSLYSYREEEGGAADTDPELDTDNDGLPDCIEQRFETDIRKTDTDDDGLSDYVELYTLALDPLSEDTDGNGLSDAEEDLDGDGLSNLTEYQIGTKIYSADTDEDGLT